MDQKVNSKLVNELLTTVAALIIYTNVHKCRKVREGRWERKKREGGREREGTSHGPSNSNNDGFAKM